jgi:hypothetical protein
MPTGILTIGVAKPNLSDEHIILLTHRPKRQVLWKRHSNSNLSRQPVRTS